MDKNQTLQGAHAGALTTGNRQLFLARFFLLALFLTLSVISLLPEASAPSLAQNLQRQAGGLAGHQLMASAPVKVSAPDCHDECERAFVECLAQGGSNCDAKYDFCAVGCMMSIESFGRT
ncbi:MAG TPA: hypothetical protein VNI02_06440 [Blastocatellia bacterium]|jgi:hypothetical protein|nr:hypothetical protein [Blastocatellia bacterium]